MRVLLVTHRYPPDGIAGVEQYTQALAKELVKAGDTVTIVTRRPGGSQEPRILRERLVDGTSVYRFTGGVVRLDFPMTHTQRLEQLFEIVLAETDPQVVHINQLIGLSPRYIEMANRLRIAVVVSLHDFWFACPLIHLRKPSGELCPGPDGGRNCGQTCFDHQRPHQGLADPVLRWGLRSVYTRRLLGMAQRVVCYSRYVASYFQEFGVDPQRVEIIPNGVLMGAEAGASRQCSTPKERGKVNLAYCGMVTPHKGAHVILDALRLAKLGPVDFLVVGQTDARKQDYVASLREQAATIQGLTLRLYGAYRRTELPLLLQDVDCVVVPSLVPEAGPIVPREAMALGIPIVVARLGALPEVIIEGENGLSFEPTQPAELAGILGRLAHEDSLLNRLRQGARNTPVTTVPGHAAAMRAVYREVVKETLYHGPINGTEASEVRFLHNALLELRFGGLT
jgi:glycosyltransferase involved in cell wall biosynthesis